jgi:hypothetical protein
MAYHWQTDDEAAAYEVKLKSLLNERDALLAQFRTEPAVDFAQGANNQTNALSPEKQQLVDEITKRYPSDLPSATATQEEVDTYYNNRKARLAYLAQYLTPDELTNYRLTQDSDVKAVALIMKALNLTPAELNSIAFALDFTQPNMVNGQFPPEVEQAFQQGLGPDRYAQYQNDYSSANIGLTQFISQTDLTPDQINQLEALQTQHQPPAVIAQTVTQFLGETFAAHYLNLVKDYTP